MDKLTAIKIKYDDGTYSDEIPVSVLSENVEWDSTHTLVDVLGSIDVDVTGTIQDQISQLFNEKVSTTQLDSYVASQLNVDVTNWLNTNVNPVGSAVVVDKSLEIDGAAADAKTTGILKNGLDNIQNYDWKDGFINIAHQIVNVSNRKYSNFIVCPENENISYVAENNHGNVFGISFYDIDFNFISGYSNNGTLGEEITVISPPNTVYCRLSTINTILNNSYVKFSTNALQNLYNKIKSFFNDIEDLTTNIEDANFINQELFLLKANSVQPKYKSPNLLNKDNAKYGGYYTITTNQKISMVKSENWWYIPVCKIKQNSSYKTFGGALSLFDINLKCTRWINGSTTPQDFETTTEEFYFGFASSKPLNTEVYLWESSYDGNYVDGENKITIDQIVNANKLKNLLTETKTSDSNTLIFFNSSGDTILEDLNPMPKTFVINGVNQWNESWEQGSYSVSNGSPQYSDSAIRSHNLAPISVVPGETYYWNFPKNINSAVLYYKKDLSYQGTYTIVLPGNTFTVPADAYYIKFYCTSDYGATYNNDIQIAFNSDTEKTKYHPYNGGIYNNIDNAVINLGHNYLFVPGTLDELTATLLINKFIKNKKDYEASYIHFSVPVNQYIVDESITTDIEKDNQNNIVNVDCILSLPSNYSKDGTPSKLIMMCHGAGRGVYGNQTAFDEQGDWRQVSTYNTLVNEFVAAGYAVFDCNGYSNTNLGCSFWGAQRGVEAWRKAYDYIIKNYNVEENLNIYGFSMGGCTALNLVFQSFPNVKCIALGSPVTTLDQVTYQHAGSTAFNAAYGISDYDINLLRGNNPMQNVLTIDGVDYCVKNIPPLKIWFGGTEEWPAPSDALRLVNAIKNSGGKADFRSVDGRGHGISYGGDPVVNHEIVMYFNRYNN